MIGFVGYNFMGDVNSLNPNIVNVGSINKIILTNGKYDNFKVDNKVIPYNIVREEWGYNTILLAKFQNDLDAGSMKFSNMTVSRLKLKRRKIEELNNWWTIYEVPYANQNKLVFEFFDNLVESQQEYEYAIVPVAADGTEGVYLTNTILSDFEGAYICEKDISYRLTYNLEYKKMNQVTKVGKFEPLGSKYPIKVKNAKINYKTGSLEAMIITDKTIDSCDLNSHRKDEVKLRENMLEFLTNGKSKILKDGNGNFWLVSINEDIPIDFQNNLAQGICKIGFDWVEIGDSQSRKDLYNNGLIDSID